MVIVAEHVPDGKPPYRLVEEIIARSVTSTWREAKLEWELDYIIKADTPGSCLCGHPNITEQCVLVNRKNANKVIVGSVCVTRFIGLPSDNLFASLRRIAKNRMAVLGVEAIEYAYGRGWISTWEHGFYLDTCSKRKLSKRQKAKRVEINELVLQMVRESRRHA
jgi:hypothetical protein